MLNIDKIKLMTNLAIYEGQDAQNNRIVNTFFKNDYISYNMIKAFINLTVSFLIFVVMYFIYNVEDIVEEIQNLDFINMGIMLAVIYLITLSLYLTISYLLYDKRYNTAKKNFKSYQLGLKRLNRTYELSSKTGDGKKEE